MVTITSYNIRQKEEGKPYITLELEGSIEMVQSQNTGRFYATVRKCIISSTFDEPTAQRMVGQQMPGTIERVQCESYDFTIKETGEVIKLGYRWDYMPDGGRKVSMPKQKAKDTTPVNTNQEPASQSSTNQVDNHVEVKA